MQDIVSSAESAFKLKQWNSDKLHSLFHQWRHFMTKASLSVGVPKEFLE